MRRQYHFWPGVEGFDAWEVDRLIRLSRDLPVQQVDLGSISEIDTVYWFDEATGPPTVRAVVDHMALIEAVDPSHPIILGPDGRVMDGMHRIARAMLEGRDRLPAVQFSELPPPDHRNCRPKDLPYE